MAYSLEQLNYFRVCHVTATIIPDYLRIVFKREWDVRYGTSHGVWEDTPKNGHDFHSKTTPKEQRHKKKELAVIKNGDSREWDCTCLFYSILFSDCIGKIGLDPVVKNSVDTLREFRNKYFAHQKDGMIKEADFQASIADVISAIEDLKLDGTAIEKIKNQTEFPTKYLHYIQSQLENERNMSKGPRPFCRLPPFPFHETISREKKTSEIYSEIKRLRNNNKEKVTVTYISGNPGCGKTQIARQIGEKYFDDMSSDVATPFVMTLDASSISSLLCSCIEFASFLKCNDTALSQITTSQKPDEEKILLLQIELINSTVATFPYTWLIIFDNADDLKLMAKFIPHAGQIGKGHVLITTQESHSIPPSTQYSRQFSLSVGMEPDEAVTSLLTISGCSFENDHIGLEVAEALDFQPLALACAAMWMQDTAITNKAINWTVLLQELQDGKQAATERVYERTTTAYPKTMTTAVKMALEKAIAKNEIWKYAFQLLSVVATGHIPLEHVVNYVTLNLPNKRKDFIASEIRLSSLILCFDEDSELMVRVHQIVHFIVNEMNQDETRDLAFWLKVLKVFAQQNDCRRPEKGGNGATQSMLLNLHFPFILIHILEYFRNHHIHTLSERLWYFIQHLNTDGLAQQYQEMLYCLINVNSTVSKMNGCTVSEVYIQAFQRLTIVLSYNDSITMLLTLISVNLGLLLRSQGRHLLAEELLTKALSAVYSENTSNFAPLGVLLTMSVLALSIKESGKYQRAKGISEMALSIIEQTLSNNNEYNILRPLIMRNFLNIHAIILLDLGYFKQSKQCFQKALEVSCREIEKLVAALSPILGNFVGPEFLGQTTILSNFGLALQKLGEHRQALACVDKSLESMDDRDCSKFAVHLRIRALALQGLGKYEEAKTVLEKAITVQERLYGNNNPWLARMLRNLASILQDLGQYLAAKCLLERTITIEESSLEQDHPTLASTLCVLGSVLRDLETYHEAKIHLDRALHIQEFSLDKEHPSIATTLFVFATVLQGLGEYSQAGIYLERALDIQEKSLGYNHPCVADTFTVFASLLQDQGEFDRAKNILKKAMGIQNIVLESNHPRLGVTLYTYASVLKDLGELDQAKVYLKKAASIQEKTLDKDHPHLLRTLSLLEYILQD